MSSENNRARKKKAEENSNLSNFKKYIGK